MTVESDPHAAKILMGLWFRRKETTSAKLYFPRFLNGSAINKRIMGQPIKKPIEYINPSNPVKYTRPEMPKKDAADIKSPDMANPFCKPEIFPPAV